MNISHITLTLKVEKTKGKTVHNQYPIMHAQGARLMTNEKKSKDDSLGDQIIKTGKQSFTRFNQTWRCHTYIYYGLEELTNHVHYTFCKY